MKTTKPTRGRLTVLTAGCLLALTLALVAGCGAAEDKASSSALAEQVAPSAAPREESGKAAADAAMSVQNSAANTTGAGQQPPAAGSSETPAAPGGFVAANPGAGASVDARKIIYKANVTMEVADYGDANTDINNLIHLSGGYLLQFSENRTDFEQSGTLVVKVPSSGFSGFLADLEKLGPKSIQRSIQGQDVTEEFVDLDARLVSKQAEETRLLEFMNKATQSDQLVAFSSQISKVQTEIEQLKGRMRYLEQNVSYSTVEIRLYQKIAKTDNVAAKAEPGFAGKLAAALNGSAGFVLGFFQGLLIVLVGALPVLAVLAVIAVPLAVVYRKRKRRAQELEERARQIRQANNTPGGADA